MRGAFPLIATTFPSGLFGSGSVLDFAGTASTCSTRTSSTSACQFRAMRLAVRSQSASESRARGQHAAGTGHWLDETSSIRWRTTWSTTRPNAQGHVTLKPRGHEELVEQAGPNKTGTNSEYSVGHVQVETLCWAMLHMFSKSRGGH